MPVYSYKCAHCQLEFEKRQSFDEEPLSTCPDCGHSVRRVPQRVDVIYRGSGWAHKDLRDKEPKP